MDAPEAMTQSVRRPTFVATVCRPGELDQPVVPVSTVLPYHPGKTKIVSEPSGTTTVDFFIDETGKIRMPVVLDATNDTYAQAAVGALNQWRFAAPTKRGHPVAVRVTQKFVFPADS